MPYSRSQGDQEVHDHNKRKEAYNSTDAADNTVCQKCGQDGGAVLELTCYPFLEHLNVADQPVCNQRSKPGLRYCNQRSQPCLGYPEDKPHDHCEDNNTQNRIEKDLVKRVLLIDLCGLDCSLFDLCNNVVYKLIALAVFCINCVLIMKIDIGLYIRCLLRLSVQGNCLFHDFRETL